MKYLYLTFLSSFLTIGTGNAQSLYFPPLVGDAWETTNPETLNWCPDKIESLYQLLEAEETKSFILLKDGKIVLEKYFGNFTQDSLWFWFSAGKSLRATLVGIAQEEGLLSINDKTSAYLGEGWTNLTASQEEKITIWHQLTMTSGLNPVFFDCITPNCLRYRADAGEQWAYHNGPYNLLKNVLEVASNQTLNRFTRTRIRDKIGMNNGFWLNAGNNTFFLSNARDMARFGLLTLNKGFWNTTPVLADTAFYNQMVSPSQALNSAYGYLWWLNGQASYVPPSNDAQVEGMIAPKAPADMFVAAGAQGQFISIVPSQNMVLIRQGEFSSSDRAPIALLNDIWETVEQLTCEPTALDGFQSPRIKIYPNPATRFIEIEGLETGQSYQVQLFNVLGDQVLRLTNTKRFNVESLVEGLYFVRVQVGEIVSTQRIIVSH